MNLNEILFTKLRVFDVMPSYKPADNVKAMTLNHEFMRYGFMMTEELFRDISHLDDKQFEEFYAQSLGILARSKGAHVKHQPMYKNFPQEVMDKSLFELFFNALVHYFSMGEWLPDSAEVIREHAYEPSKLILIGKAKLTAVGDALEMILMSKDSISDFDKAAMTRLAECCDSDVIPTHKEILCQWAGILYGQGKPINHLITNATDVLRFVTYMNGGDVSLSENTKFKSMKRSERRMIIDMLAPVVNEDDISRHANKWKRLFHSLHAGEYSHRHPKLGTIVKRTRDGQLTSWYSLVESAMGQRDFDTLLSLLSQRPGELHRRMDYLMRDYPKRAGEVIRVYKSVIDRIPNRLLFQLLGHLKNRSSSREMVIFPKSSNQKATVIPRPAKAPATRMVSHLAETINQELIRRFKDMGALSGKVWMDGQLFKCPLPTQQRSASDSLWTVARGSRLEASDHDFIRLFIHWKGRDVDLSASLLRDDFSHAGHISFTCLKDEYGNVHSGDITSAPNGASEFIDINVQKCLDNDIRYVAASVYDYSQVGFNNIEECFMGWMGLDNPGHNDIFQPKQVQQKISVTQECSHVTPVVFDLKEREVIWVDVVGAMRDYRPPVMIESTRMTIEKMVEVTVKKVEQSYTIGDLFMDHIIANDCDLVDDPDEADIKLGVDMNTCDVSVYDISVINSKFM